MPIWAFMPIYGHECLYEHECLYIYVYNRHLCQYGYLLYSYIIYAYRHFAYIGITVYIGLKAFMPIWALGINDMPIY